MLLYLWPILSGRAQSFSPINIRYAGPASLQSGAPASEESIGFYELDFGAAKVNSTREGRVIFSFRYNHVKLDHNNWPADLPQTDPLHNLQFSTILQGDLTSNWRITFVMTPGLASDFGVASGTSSPSFASLFSFFDSFYFSTSLIVARKRSEHHAAGFGVNIQEDRKPSLLPLLQIYWNDGGNVRADILAPAYARIWFKAPRSIDVGLLWQAAFSAYRLSGNNQHRAEGQMRRQAFSVSSALRIPVNKAAAIQLEGGLMVRHNLYYVAEEETIHLGRGQFVKLGLVLTATP